MQSMDESRKAIGVFDSGIGGLTVLKALIERLPRESTVYLGDTARVPYGTKSAAVITRYSLNNARFLARSGIKALVVACNTASSVALEALAAELPIPVVGVIEPGAASVASVTRTGRVGVIGTYGTIASGAYQAAILRARPATTVITRACPLFVPLAEEGWIDGPVVEGVAKTYLGDLANSGIDALVLGCTHYPLLRAPIAAVLGPAVTLIDSAHATAESVARLFAERGLESRDGHPTRRFFVTDSPERFAELGPRFLGQPIAATDQVDL
jgi:glutamate racemase